MAKIEEITNRKIFSCNKILQNKQKTPTFQRDCNFVKKKMKDGIVAKHQETTSIAAVPVVVKVEEEEGEGVVLAVDNCCVDEVRVTGVGGSVLGVYG